MPGAGVVTAASSSRVPSCRGCCSPWLCGSSTASGCTGGWCCKGTDCGRLKLPSPAVSSESCCGLGGGRGLR
eukprot:628986-Lingulodinium_polyedra.AAC.1